MFLLLPRAGANKNFVPDWTFQGSSLGAARTLGNASWRAENGEIVGTPKTAEGGWLILDKPLQDVQFASTFRCTGGCRAGVMLRTQSTPEGMQGVYVALPEGENPAAAFALKLDPQGREIQREPLNRAGRHGPVHRATAGKRTGRPGACPAGRGGGRAGGGRGFGPAALPAELALHPSRLCLPAERVESAGDHPRRQLSSRRGSMMDRRAEAPTARPTRTSRSTAPWRCT